MPKPTIAPTAVHGSYERWQYVIGGVLQSAGINGFCRANFYERDMLNDEQSDTAMMLNEMFNVFGETRFSARNVHGVGIVQRTAWRVSVCC